MNSKKKLIVSLFALIILLYIGLIVAFSPAKLQTVSLKYIKSQPEANPLNIIKLTQQFKDDGKIHLTKLFHINFKPRLIQSPLTISSPINKWHLFFQQKPILKKILQPGIERTVISALNLKSKSLYEELLLWEQNRRPVVLFPIKDARGVPTKAMFILLSSLVHNGYVNDSFLNKVGSLRIGAPKDSWGAFEKVILSLFYLSNHYSFDEISWVFERLQSPRQLERLTAFLQSWPDQSNQIFVSLSKITPDKMDAYLSYIAKWKLKGLSNLEHTLTIDQNIYDYLLRTGKGIGRDWPKWMLPSLFLLPRWQNMYYQSEEKFFQTKCIVLFIVVFIRSCLMVSPNKMNWNVQIPLYFLISTLVTAFLITAMEEKKFEALEYPKLEIGQNFNQEQLFQDDEQPTGRQAMNGLSFLFSGLFLVTQIILFLISKSQILKIVSGKESSVTKLKLLENEEHLFDMGLYVGLGGTVLSLIFLAIGWSDIGLMAAYTSTLFGIVEVALLKLWYLRPNKRKLILLQS